MSNLEDLKEFEKWFQNLLLHRTKSCNERDVFRYAKEALEQSYLQMCAEQDDRNRVWFSLNEERK